MTSTDLYAIVKDLRDHWPEGMDYRDAENGYRPHFACDNGTFDYITPQNALLIFEGEWSRRVVEAGFSEASFADGWAVRGKAFPTRIEALAAAMKEITR